MLTNEQVRVCLDEIADSNGGILLAEEVVHRAADEKHLLHDRFEWDDAAAAHSHRIDQARALIRGVRIEIVMDERSVKSVYYVEAPMKVPGQAGYIAIPKAQTNQEMVSMIVAQEISRAASALQRAIDVSAALGVTDALSDMLVRLRVLAEKLPSKKAA